MKFLLTFTLAIITTALFAQTKVDADDAAKYMGEKVTINGKITGAAVRNSGKQIVLNVGPSSSSTFFTIVINQSDRKNFSYTPETFLVNKSVSLTGKVIDVNGVPAIVATRPEDIRLESEGGEVEIRPLGFEIFNKFFDDK